MPGDSIDVRQANRIAVIGRADIVVAFGAVGLAVFPVVAGRDASGTVENLVAAGYRVIFFTEDLFAYLLPVLERYRRGATPCLVALPLGGGQGVARLKEMVRRAVGAGAWGHDPGSGEPNAGHVPVGDLLRG